jgi:hypothetical protein
MAAWHYDLFLVATGPVEIGAMKSRLSRDLASIASPSPNLLLWGVPDGNRIDFWTDHQPLQLLARFDLRAPTDSFRRLVLELAREFSLQLLNADDVEVPPHDSALQADIQTSAAAAAVANSSTGEESESLEEE